MTTRMACVLSLALLLGCDRDESALRKTLSAQETPTQEIVNATDTDAIWNWARRLGSRPELVIVLADREVREIDATGHIGYTVQVPGRTCVADGRIEETSNSEGEFEALILWGRTTYSDWENGMATQGVESGRRTAWSFSELLPNTGAWHFVVSNRFSEQLPKTVSVTVRVTCPGTA